MSFELLIILLKILKAWGYWEAEFSITHNYPILPMRVNIALIILWSLKIKVPGHPLMSNNTSCNSCSKCIYKSIVAPQILIIQTDLIYPRAMEYLGSKVFLAVLVFFFSITYWEYIKWFVEGKNWKNVRVT